VIVLLVLLMLTGPLAFLPDAVLSAVVFMICMGLIDLKGMHRIYRHRPWEFWVALITAAIVVIVGVEQGILTAMFLSLFSHTRDGYRPKNLLIESDAAQGWKDRPVDALVQMRPGLMIYRFSHGMYYANAGLLAEQVTMLVKKAHPGLVWFCIDAGAVDDIDFTAAETLRFLYTDLKACGVRLVLAGLSDDARKCLDRSELTSLIGADDYFSSTAQVVDAYRLETVDSGATE
jgi:SulP family sulfate permease